MSGSVRAAGDRRGQVGRRNGRRDLGVERPAFEGSTWAYKRISDDRTGRMAGTGRQDKDIRREAGRRGHTGPIHFEMDNDIGASEHSKPKRRVGYEKVLEAVKSGKVTDLWVWHPDRLYRIPLEFEELVPVLRANGVRLWSVHGGRIDIANPEGVLLARSLSMINAFFVDHMREQVLAASAERAESGRANGGKRPYGWRYAGGSGVLVPIEREYAVIAELTRRIVRSGDGDSCRALAAELRARKEPTAVRYRTLRVEERQKVSLRKAEWVAESVRTVVLRAANAGLRVHHGDLYPAQWGRMIKLPNGTDEWGAAVTVSEWEAACAIIGDPKRRTSSTAPAERYLLTGIATCHDGHVFRSAGKKKGYRTYGCRFFGTDGKEHDHLNRQAEKVEDLVYAVLCGTPSTPGLLAREGLRMRTEDTGQGLVIDARTKKENLEAQLERFEDALSGYPDDDLKVMSPAGLKRNIKRIRTDLEEARRTIDLHAVPDVLDGVSHDITEADFRSLPMERQRAILRRVLTITIHPTARGSRFNPDAIVIGPRHAPTA